MYSCTLYVSLQCRWVWLLVHVVAVVCVVLVIFFFLFKSPDSEGYEVTGCFVSEVAGYSLGRKRDEY